MTEISLSIFSIDELLKDSDSEPEEVQKDNRPKLKAKRTMKGNQEIGKAWLHEGGDDDITDFMDTSAAKKVMGKISFMKYFCKFLLERTSYLTFICETFSFDFINANILKLFVTLILLDPKVVSLCHQYRISPA